MSKNPVSSTPVLRAVLVWSAAVTLPLLVIAAVVGLLVAGIDGLWSALLGVALAAVFLAITSASILVANRWYGDPLYVPVFFGVVLGGWIVKFVIFLVALLVLRRQPWIEPVVFFLAVVVSVLASLLVDVIVLVRHRIPHVGDVALPTDPAEGDRRDVAPRESGDSAAS